MLPDRGVSIFLFFCPPDPADPDNPAEFVLYNSIGNDMKRNCHMDDSQIINKYNKILDVILNLNRNEMNK